MAHRENRQYMKSLGISYNGVELGRPRQNKEERRRNKKDRIKRVMVEGKFGEGKRKYQLDLVKAKQSDTGIPWIASVLFVMNIAHLLRVIFLSIFKTALFLIKKDRNNLNSCIGQDILKYMKLYYCTF